MSAPSAGTLDLLVALNITVLVSQVLAFHSVGELRPHARLVAHLSALAALVVASALRLSPLALCFIGPPIAVVAGVALVVFIQELRS